MATTSEINKAYAYLERYGYLFQLDEDDKQDVIFHFHKYYKASGGTSVDTFTNTLMRQNRINKIREKQSFKHSGSTSTYDAYESSDWIKYLSVDEAHPIEVEEADNALKEQVCNLLDKLTYRQRYVLEQVYLEERSQLDVANELGITRQGVNELIRYVSKKLRNE